jgi:hypothetical protein
MNVENIPGEGAKKTPNCKVRQPCCREEKKLTRRHRYKPLESEMEKKKKKRLNNNKAATEITKINMGS